MVLHWLVQCKLRCNADWYNAGSMREESRGMVEAIYRQQEPSGGEAVKRFYSSLAYYTQKLLQRQISVADYCFFVRVSWNINVTNPPGGKP